MTTKERCILSLEEEIRQKRIECGRKGGRASKRNHRTPITIKNLKTKEVHQFDAMEQCAKFLSVSKKTLWKFNKGEKSRLDCLWQLIKNKQV